MEIKIASSVLEKFRRTAIWPNGRNLTQGSHADKPMLELRIDSNRVVLTGSKLIVLKAIAAFKVTSLGTSFLDNSHTWL